MKQDDVSLTVFRLPRHLWHCDLEHYQWDAVKPASLRTHYFAFLDAAHAGEAPHLLLTGSPGIGKTHLGIAAYRWMVLRLGTELVTWVNVPAFCDEVKAAYDGGHDPFLEYEQARRFVVLDDLFGRTLTKHEANQIVARLLDTAHQNGAAVLLTMNPAAEDLAASLQPHEVSRVLAQAKIIPMTAPYDWRRKT